MSNSVDPNARAFLLAAIETQGNIDPHDLSPATRTACIAAGLDPRLLESTHLTGRDGRIDNGGELAATVNVVTKYVKRADRPVVYRALLAEMAEHQATTPTLKDAMTVSLPLRPELADALRPVSLALPAINQFSLDRDAKKANAMCFQAARMQLEQFSAQHHETPPRLADKSQRIQVATSESATGHVCVDPEKAASARAYIDECLEHGRPVLVGVSIVGGEINEGLTEHFVTICGRGIDERQRLFYEFRDPGARAKLSRFYVEEATGKLFKPGSSEDELLRAGTELKVENLFAEVTQVRTYADRPLP